jgi:hypothetical protein
MWHAWPPVLRIRTIFVRIRILLFNTSVSGSWSKENLQNLQKKLSTVKILLLKYAHKKLLYYFYFFSIMFVNYMYTNSIEMWPGSGSVTLIASNRRRWTLCSVYTVCHQLKHTKEMAFEFRQNRNYDSWGIFLSEFGCRIKIIWVATFNNQPYLDFDSKSQLLYHVLFKNQFYFDFDLK